MRWRWLYFDFIPPELGLDPQLSRDVRADVKYHRSSLSSKEGLIRSAFAFFAFVLNGGLILFLFRLTQSRIYFSSSFFLLPLLLSLFFAVTSYLLFFFIYAPLRAKRTYLELRLRGVDICPNCAYSLRAIPNTTRCPECATAVTPVTRPSSPPDATPSTLHPPGFQQWR